MEKSFRVHTNIGEDTLLHVDMRQDFDFLEILSLKLGQSDAYRLHSSNYGVIVGRVLANDAFGIPNARVSMFVERDTNDTTDLERIYPYSELFDKDKDGRRYNLLPDYSDDKCYRVVGTFPNKRFLLDNDTYIEVYEKYWKYTTVTNAVGDYMLFGVPSGSQQIHVDIDLSDIGILSQKPRDFEYKGYEITQFDNSSQFKESTNLDNLSQLFTENKGVTVYPFWGDSNNGPAAITRSDVQIQYKFEPTCVFMGSIISDNDTNSIGHKCAPSVNTGKNNQLVAGEGTIEMIRVTTDGLVEDFQIQGNRLIDSDGVWCYQIPMNLDYIGMDEYGNIVATNDPSKGIPTRTRVRFRISKTESGDEGFSRHTAKYLVPNNPEFDDTSVIPKIKDPKRFNRSYVFGSATPRECFRDLYWNNVYSVKNYIPKTQVSHRATSKNYNSLKSANFANDKNTLPFNKLFIDVKFSYMIICILFYIVIKLLKPINAIINALMWLKYKIRIPLIGLKIFGFIPDIECIPIAAGLSDDSKAYYPGCRCPDSPACKISKCPEDAESGKCEKSSNDKDLIDKVQQNLANEYELVNLDLQNDWINGALYMPLWYWRKAKKKRFLFWTIRKAKSEFCDCDKKYSRMKTYLTCDIKYDNNSLKHTLLKKEKKWHKSQKKGVWFPNGLIKPVENKDGLTVYYYVSANPRGDQDPEGHPGQKTTWYDDIEKYPDGFYAVRLFATDIILLGSLWENNMYGIPQLFKNLPSTTSNVPAISTIVENTTDVDDDNSTSDAAVGTESGITITTGMDCGYKGEKQNPQYSTGLFMDLSCTAAKTYEKSCINVERLSEYGVSLDMSYKMPYAQGGDIQYGEILPDGFISKYELDDTENRAMFATMNHVGFYPQDTQDIVGRRYDTQVDDKYTRYPIPKMQYIYPVDFDGRMDESMKAYTSTNTFKQLTREKADEAYLTFRLGGEADNTNTRVRHFYYTKDALQMPVYNNSFYFYFGANKGNTAIEKFHKLFWADCFQNNKYPFSLVIEKNPKSYCPDAYKDECATMKYGYIRVILEDILTDYSYTLYDSYNRVVVSEQMMTARDFVIGGFIDGETGEVKSNPGGVVQPQSEIFGNVKTVVEPQEGYVLENGTYRLSVTDVNGKTVTERVTLDQPKISLSYTTTDIGTRFYDTERTSISYICNDEYDFYGVISITGIFVDGVEYTFQDGTLNVIDEPVRGEGGEYYTVIVSGSGECVEGDKLQAIIKISLPEKADSDDEETEGEPDTFADCMCDNDNRYSNGILVAESMGTDIESPYYYHPYTATTEEEKRIEFYVYQPNQYLITVTQLCNEVPMDETYDGVPNSTTYTATIRSGEDFDVALNTMPLRFMLGSTTDSASMEISKNSHFYGKVVETNLEKSDISGWFGVHHEQVPYKNDKNTSPYQFWRYPTNKNNEQIWTNYVNIEDGDVDSVVSKSLIAQYKFRTMFALANGVYCSNEFTLQASGGTSPILYRSVLPDYAGEAFTTENQDVAYILGTTNTTTVVEEFPNIVTKYFLNMHNGEYTMSDSKSQGPIWNIAYGKKANNMVGNYFAAFTNNGGYTSSGEALDKKKGVLRAPSMASVSPVNGEQNNLIPLNTRYTSTDVGKNFKPAHTQMKQRLTGDKERTVNPYMRALNVDRRIDFNFLVFAPILSKSFDINEENPITWRGGRVSGMTFNGIEMSYITRNHNIIDANWREYYSTDEGWKTGSTSDENTDVEKFYGATPNKRLEYSYNAIQTSDAQQGMTFDMDGYTVYNYGNDYVWERDTDETSLKKQINKRLYGAMIGSNDVRDYFWSEGNENRMRKCIADTQAHSEDTDSLYARTHIDFCGDIGNDAYIFPHTMDEAGYNGDFNMFQYLRNYPTKRLLDIGGLKTRANYTFSFTPCSYSISAEMLENGKLEAEAGEGDSLEFSIDFTNPVVFTTPNADNQEYYNSLYNVKKDGAGLCVDKEASRKRQQTTHYVYEPTVFESVSSEVYFTPAQRSNSDFRIRIGAPRVIAVLPYPLTNSVDQHNSKDAITAIKLSTTKKQLYEKIGYEPLNAKKNLALQMLYASEKSGSVVLSGTKVKNAPKGVKLLYAPSSVDPNDLYMYLMKNKKEHLHSDDTDTQSVMFYNKFKVNKNRNKTPLVYCVLMENEYVWQNEDGLVRGMRVLEFSDLIDVRDIKIQCAIQTTDQIETYTYIQKRDVNAEESSSGDDDQGGGDSGGDDQGGSTDKKNQVVVQYLAFNVHIDDGVKGTNQAFYDWENMSFAIKVNNKYYINAYNFENGDRLPFFKLSTQDSVSVTGEVLERVFGYDEAVEYAASGNVDLDTTTTSSVTGSLVSAIHAIENDKYAVVKYDYKLLTTACTASNIYTRMPELDFTQNVVSENDCDVYPTTSANTKACNMVVYEKGNYVFTKAVFSVTATTYTSTTTSDFIKENNQINSNDWHSATTFSAVTEPYVIDEPVTSSTMMGEYVIPTSDVDNKLPQDGNEALSFFTLTEREGQFLNKKEINGATRTGYTFPVNSRETPIGGDTAYGVKIVEDGEMFGDDGGDVGHVEYATDSDICGGIQYQVRYADGEPSVVPDERENRKIQNVLVHFMLDSDMNILDKMKKKDNTVKCKFYAKTASNYTYCLDFKLKLEGKQGSAGDIDPGESEGAKVPTYVHIVKQ